MKYWFKIFAMTLVCVLGPATFACFLALGCDAAQRCVKSHKAPVEVPARSVTEWVNSPERAEITTYYPAHTEIIDVCDEYERSK